MKAELNVPPYNKLSIIIIEPQGFALRFFIGRISENRAKACFRMIERRGTKKGLIPRRSAAESAIGAGTGLCPAVLIPFINFNEYGYHCFT